MAKRNNEEIKLFITRLMEEEQDTHSGLIVELGKSVGLTEEFVATSKVLKQVHSAKMDLLERIYKEL